MDSNREFYDIHYHVLDLSHANLLAFLLRDDLVNSSVVRNIVKKIPFLIRAVPIGLSSLFPGRIASKIREYLQKDSRNFRNLLSVMESAVEYHFLYVEYFLMKAQDLFGYNERSRYNKIIISPQIIDFGYKNLDNSDCFYNIPPSKPVINQVVDLLNAIWFYYNCMIVPHPERLGRLKVIPCQGPRNDKLFEIYPFIGINTVNYDLDEIVAMFGKYFSGYENDTPPGRRKKMYDRLGTVKIGLEDMLSKNKERSDPDYFSYIFAGVKLYPPLGFDPWPDDDPAELEKVRFLYSECARKRLPLTVHCSDGGFRTTDDYERFTDPSGKWRKVLSRPECRNLKINFAHLGSRKDRNDAWRRSILESIKLNKNVYSDCSCITPKKEDYTMIKSIMDEEREKNLLFGSDFVINLLWSGSYNEYLENFILTPYLDERQKELMCRVNPERFLFG